MSSCLLLLLTTTQRTKKEKKARKSKCAPKQRPFSRHAARPPQWGGAHASSHTQQQSVLICSRGGLMTRNTLLPYIVDALTPPLSPANQYFRRLGWGFVPACHLHLLHSHISHLAFVCCMSFSILHPFCTALQRSCCAMLIKAHCLITCFIIASPFRLLHCSASWSLCTVF